MGVVGAERPFWDALGPIAVLIATSRTAAGLRSGCTLRMDAPPDFLQRLFCAACAVAIEVDADGPLSEPEPGPGPGPGPEPAALERLGIRIREAAADADAELIAATLLQAGRDASTDDSPFGLAALMAQPGFQDRQLQSSLGKVQKTRDERRSLPAAGRTSCLWIAEDAASGERLGAVGVFKPRDGEAPVPFLSTLGLCLGSAGSID
jgi:hypothetical protein